MKTIAILFTISAFLLAGCQTTAPTDDVKAVAGFRASYDVYPRGSLDVWFDGPVLIADWDLEQRLAYRLEVRAELPGFTDPETAYPSNLGWLIYYLDSELKVARVEQPCATIHGGNCRSSIISWREAGLLPPLGLLWPMATTSFSDYSLVAGGSPTSLAVKSTTSGEKVRLDIDAESIPASDWLLDFSGTIDFDDDAPVPFRINGASTLHHTWEIDARLAGFESFSALQPADRWPTRLFQGAPETHEVDLFPGAEQPFLNRSYSPRDAYRFLLAESEAARAKMDSSGCVMRVSIVYDVPGGSDATILTELDDQFYEERIDQINFEITGANGGAERFVVKNYTGNLRKPERFEYHGGKDTNNSLECPRRAAAEHALTFPEFGGLLKTRPFGAGLVLQSYRVDWYDQNAHWDTPLGFGRLIATYNLVDDTAAWNGQGTSIPYHAIMRAAPGWWDEVWLPSETVAALDRRPT